MAKRQPGTPQKRNPWLPAIAAGCVLGVVVIAGVSGGGQGDASTPTTLDPGLGSVDSLSTVPLSTPAPIVTDTSVAVVKTTLAAPIAKGAFGDDVVQLQQRLTDLGFAPGPIDGSFGTGTQQAVWAWKKLVGGMTWQDLDFSNSATVVTPEIWSKMQDPTVIAPKRPQPAGATHVEVYLPLQVLAVFTDNKPVLIAHISSGQLDEAGNPKEFCETAIYDTDENGNPLDPPVEKAICADAKTPGGMFRFTRRYEGKRISPLGGMLNPVYFNYGIAIHGAQGVPTHPASHGCVRVSNEIAEYFPSLVSNRDAVFVWGHDGKEPESYSKAESLPSFNRLDPNATTTTSSSTTTTTVASEAPTTVAAPATTVKPSATTVKPPATTVPPATTAAPAPTAAPVTTAAPPPVTTIAP
jgi:hypothetical protein